MAAVKISSVRRKAAQKFWAPQQGHPPPVPSAPLPKGGWHGKAVTGGFHTSPHLLQPFRRGGVLPRPREGQSPSPTHHKIRFRRGRPPGRPARPLTAAHATHSWGWGSLAHRRANRFPADLRILNIGRKFLPIIPLFSKIFCEKRKKVCTQFVKKMESSDKNLTIWRLKNNIGLPKLEEVNHILWKRKALK